MIKHIPTWLFVVLFIFDTVYSFRQHYHAPLDGDLARIVLPIERYNLVLSDPFGLSALVDGKYYPGPNRFFAHGAMVVYFKRVPFFLQNFVSPISSVYLSCAIAKTAIQIFMIWLLAVYIAGSNKFFKKEFWWVVVLVFPLFQTCGYNILMGIIDKSITYNFFYAFPLGLLMLFFLPFYENFREGADGSLNIFQKFLLLLLAIVLAFNGPLVAGVVLIICPAVLFYFFYKKFISMGELPFVKRICLSISGVPRQFLFYFSFMILLCGYSLLVGRYNSEGIHDSIPLLTRYANIPIGLYLQYKQKLAFPLLTLFIIINAVLIKKRTSLDEGGRMLFALKLLLLFSVVYLLLLPLGGARDYRQYIVRRDTMLPITLGMIYWFALSTFYLIKNITLRYRRKYMTAVAIFLAVFIIADEPNFDENNCERNALHQLATSKEEVVELSGDCTVMAWEKINKPYKSATYTSMLKYWNVIQEKKLYFQK